jgi:hypothetical protein
MSTQFDTGQTTIQYWDEIAAGPAQLPVKDDSYVDATAAYVARNKALAGALASPVSNTTVVYTITAVSANGTDITFTAANNLAAGAKVRLAGLGGRYTVLNDAQVTVISSGLSATQFKIASAVGAPQSLTITAVSGSGTAVTFTAANTLVAGDQVTFAALGGAYTGFNTGTYTVIATGLSTTHFEVTSATTGSTTTGTGTGTAASTTGEAFGSNAGPALPSVGIDASLNENTTYTKNPPRYVL